MYRIRKTVTMIVIGTKMIFINVKAMKIRVIKA